MFIGEKRKFKICYFHSFDLIFWMIIALESIIIYLEVIKSFSIKDINPVKD